MHLRFTAVLAAVMLPALNAQPGKATSGAAEWPMFNRDLAKAERTAKPAETITGKILKVGPSQKLLILEDASGVTFDMRLTRSTRIQSGDQKLMLNQLANDTKMHVSVKFVPERSGDIARLVQITG